MRVYLGSNACSENQAGTFYFVVHGGSIYRRGLNRVSDRRDGHGGFVMVPLLSYSPVRRLINNQRTASALDIEEVVVLFIK